MSSQFSIKSLLSKMLFVITALTSGIALAGGPEDYLPPSSCEGLTGGMYEMCKIMEGLN